MRKKILVVDPLSYSGHVNYNHGIIRAVAYNFDFDVIVNESMGSKLQEKGIKDIHFIKTYPKEWSIEILSLKKNKVAYHIASRFYFLKVLWDVIRSQNKYDGIIITCIDVYAFALVSWMFSSKTCVVDHGIGSIDNNKLYKAAWMLISNKIKIIVLEDYIKKMVGYNLHNRNIYVVHHPFPVFQNIIKDKENEDAILVFAPSASNDENFIDKLKHFNIPDGIKIVAKSKQSEYAGKNLIFYKGFISAEEYNHYLSGCDYILLAYERTYNYRISAVLFEAVQLGKRVLLHANNTLSYYADVFFEGVQLFDTTENMLEMIRSNSLKHVEYSKRALYSDSELALSLYEAMR